MITKIVLEGTAEQYHDGLKLRKVPLKFRDWADNSNLVRKIYGVFGQRFYVVREDALRLTHESIAHSLEYYDDVFRAPLDQGQINLPLDYYPDFSLLASSQQSEYDIIRVHDELALNFMLSCTYGDNVVSILSENYNLAFLSDVWNDYYENQRLRYGSVNFYEYFCHRTTQVPLESGTLAWLDTYPDNEDGNHFLEITKLA